MMCEPQVFMLWAGSSLAKLALDGRTELGSGSTVNTSLEEAYIVITVTIFH